MPNNVNIVELRALMAKAQLKVPIAQLSDREGFSCGGFEDENGYLGHAEYDEDAALIVAAVNALPALLDLAERAQTARNDALREAAAWHSMRARETPDAFEMELHCESEASIFSLIKEPTDAA